MLKPCKVCKEISDSHNNQIDGMCLDCYGESLNGVRTKPIKKENINNPSHYNQGKIEVIDAIIDWKLGFCLGNAIKYIARCEHKNNKKEDLEKAIEAWNRRAGEGEFEVGDEVWFVVEHSALSDYSGEQVYWGEIHFIHINEEGTVFALENDIADEEVNKIYKTKEEAEQALKELEEK